MNGQLPPSKFGKGYTYGGGPDPTQVSSPAIPPPASAAPPPAPPVSPPSSYAGFGSGAPATAQPAPNPYLPPTAPSPTPAPAPNPAAPPPFVNPHTAAPPPANPYAAAPPPTPGWNAGPSQSGLFAGGSANAFLTSGDGAPKTAAVLSIVGGLWAAFSLVERGTQVKYLFKFFKYATHMPAGSGWYYITLLATLAEIAAVPVLLAAGYMLWQRNTNAIKAVSIGNGLVIAANLILAVAVNKATSALTAAVNRTATTLDNIGTKLGFHPSQIIGEYSSEVDSKIKGVSTEFIAVHLVLPAVLAVVALFLVRSVATKLWVQPQTGYLP